MRSAASFSEFSYRVQTLMVAGLLCLLPGCPSPSQESQALAVVNGKSITQTEFDRLWAELPDARRAHYGEEGGKRRFLDDLITHELLVQEARRLGLDRSPALQERVEQFKERMILDDLTRQVIGAADVSDAELDAYLAEHRDGSPTEPEVRVAQIVVENQALARQLKRQLDHGGSFTKLATRFSIDKASRSNGGDLGVFRPGSTAPEIDTTVSTLKTGMISDPIKTASGYHLIKILSRESPDPGAVQGAREQMRRELEAEKRLKQYADFIAKLRTNAVIRTQN